MRIGFIGQGTVGRAIADDFENRGYEAIRYSLEERYAHNKEQIQECNIVFIAVPTPTVSGTQDLSHVMDALDLLRGENKIAVIKSTILPGTTDVLQKKYRNILIVHSPEFLSANTAIEEAANPFINIIGIPKGKKVKDAITQLIAILPLAPLLVCTSNEAEIIKFSHNIHGYFQVVLWNIFYDYAQEFSADWDTIKEALRYDPMISKQYINPLHKNGRGAGGDCFIKDYSSFIEHFKKTRPMDTTSRGILQAVERKNLELLIKSQKDLNILRRVYGDVAVQTKRDSKHPRRKHDHE